MSDFNAALEKAKAIAAKLSKKATNAAHSPASSIGMKRSLDDVNDSEFERDGKKSNSADVFGSAGGVKEQHEVSIPNRLVGLVIGKGGETLKRIQRECGVSIQFSPDDKQDERLVFITGSPPDIDEAKRQIDDIISNSNYIKAQNAANNVNLPPGHRSVEYQVPTNRVGLVIGKGGETIVSLQQKTTCKIFITPDSAADMSLPYRLLTITGTDECIDMARGLLDEIVHKISNPNTGSPLGLPFNPYGPPGAMPYGQQPGYPGQPYPPGMNSITDNFFVVNEKVGLIIGKGGETFKAIQTTYNVKLVIDTTPVPQGRSVSITGEAEDVAYAKKYIEDKVNGINTSRCPTGYHKTSGFAGGFGYATDAYGQPFVDPFAQVTAQQAPQPIAQPYPPQPGYYEDPYAQGYAQQQQYYQQPPPSSTEQQQPAQALENPYGFDAAAYASDPNYVAWYSYYYGAPPPGAPAPAPPVSESGASAEPTSENTEVKGEVKKE